MLEKILDCGESFSKRFPQVEIFKFVHKILFIHLIFLIFFLLVKIFLF